MHWLWVCVGQKLSYTRLGLQTHIECRGLGDES